jgi:hypothetical protein
MTSRRKKRFREKKSKLEYQLHELELIFVFAFLNHPLRFEVVDAYHVDELFHREWMILKIDNK